MTIQRVVSLCPAGTLVAKLSATALDAATIFRARRAWALLLGGVDNGGAFVAPAPLRRSSLIAAEHSARGELVVWHRLPVYEARHRW